MELVTSGLESMPTRLTPKAIYCLSFHEHEKIQETLFVVQVVAIRQYGKSADDSDEQSPMEKKPSNYIGNNVQGLKLQVSDGIGSAIAIMNHEVITEL